MQKALYPNGYRAFLPLLPTAVPSSIQLPIQQDRSVQLAVNEFGSGRAVYLSGLPYSFANSRLLHRAVLWSVHSEPQKPFHASRASSPEGEGDRLRWRGSLLPAFSIQLPKDKRDKRATPALFCISFPQNFYHFVICCSLYPGNSLKVCV